MAILEKSGQQAVLPVGADTQGEIKITLHWQKSGLFSRIFSGAVDLDLGCCYQTAAGRRMLLDCLQFGKDQGGPRDIPSRQGCYTQPPYIWHSGDDPGTGLEAEETLYVNPAGLAELSSITVYVYIYDGPARWHAIDASVRISVPGADDVEIKLCHDTQQRFLAVCRIDVLEGKELRVTDLGTCHDGHADCDRAYGWGFRYAK